MSVGPSVKTKRERLQLIQERLEKAPCASTHDEAFTMLANIVNEVENEHSGVPYDPTAWMADGRIYPPQLDSKRACQVQFACRYRTKGHHVFIGDHGAVVFQSVATMRIEFSKPGWDGQELQIT
jgi:hypothetical protein